MKHLGLKFYELNNTDKSVGKFECAVIQSTQTVGGKLS